MSIKNQVISGDYENRHIESNWTASFLFIRKDSITKLAKITKDTVQSYRLIRSETELKGSSVLKRAAVGTALVGPLGLLAGLTAKKRDLYYVKVFFKDGKESIIVLDDDLYKILNSSLSIKDTSKNLEDLKLIYDDLDLPYSDRKPTKHSIAKQLEESNKKEIEEANARKAMNNKLYLEKSQKLNEMLTEKIIDQDEFVELMSGLLDKYKE